MAKIVFMGTPAFAVPSLKALMQAHDVIGVVTQPDRPAGRKRRLRESPIKSLARAADIPIMQPQRIREVAAIEALSSWDADVYMWSPPTGRYFRKRFSICHGLRHSQCACIAAASLAGRRADSSGDKGGGQREWRHYHAGGCRLGYRPLVGETRLAASGRRNRG